MDNVLIHDALGLTREQLEDALLRYEDITDNEPEMSRFDAFASAVASVQEG